MKRPSRGTLQHMKTDFLLSDFSPLLMTNGLLAHLRVLLASFISEVHDVGLDLEQNVISATVDKIQLQYFTISGRPLIDAV